MVATHIWSGHVTDDQCKWTLVTFVAVILILDRFIAAVGGFVAQLPHQVYYLNYLCIDYLRNGKSGSDDSVGYWLFHRSMLTIYFN